MSRWQGVSDLKIDKNITDMKSSHSHPHWHMADRLLFQLERNGYMYRSYLHWIPRRTLLLFYSPSPGLELLWTVAHVRQSGLHVPILSMWGCEQSIVIHLWIFPHTEMETCWKFLTYYAMMSGFKSRFNVTLVLKTAERLPNLNGTLSDTYYQSEGITLFFIYHQHTT